jgi:predicted DNA-binding antitoxin AbrB/MazE fold protein
LAPEEASYIDAVFKPLQEVFDHLYADGCREKVDWSPLI